MNSFLKLIFSILFPRNSSHIQTTNPSKKGFHSLSLPPSRMKHFFRNSWVTFNDFTSFFLLYFTPPSYINENFSSLCLSFFSRLFFGMKLKCRSTKEPASEYQQKFKLKKYFYEMWNHDFAVEKDFFFKYLINTHKTT